MDLNINGLSFNYGSKEVLNGIEFAAGKGEIIGILGENGCGKTTLLKCINMLLRPDAGTIVMAGVPDGVLDPNTESLGDDGTAEVSKMRPKELARCMGVVSQSSFVTFPYTALDAVMMGRYARSGSVERSNQRDLESAYAALKTAGAEEFADRNVMELSGGEFRRVMIARALAQEPAILLLDEPTLHLDVRHQFDLMELVKRFSRDMDILIVLVTHDMVFAARYCDKVLLMEKGKIVAAGTTAEVMTEENMRDIFHIDTEIRYDERIKGLNVTMLNKYTKEKEV